MLTRPPLVKPLLWRAITQNKLIESIIFILLKMSLNSEGFYGVQVFLYNNPDRFLLVLAQLVPKFLEEGFNGVYFYHRSDIDAWTKSANHFPHIFRIHILTPERVRLTLLGLPIMNTASCIR